MTNIQVLALYEFTSVKDPKAVQEALLSKAPSDLLGTLIVAKEGINGTISGSKASIEEMMALLESLGFLGLEHKLSAAEDVPFLRFKVLLKPEIVTLGEDVDPCQLVGQYVSVQDWNDLIQQPDVLLIDTRNDYEYALGTFKGAVNPKTDCFRDFPAFVATLDKKKYKRVAMFCTGGIRCEKASSYMLQQGFEELYHLKGGILKYLEEANPASSLWEGSCFVFDRRVAINHGLKISGHKSCYACRSVLSVEEQEHVDYQKGVSCHKCKNKMSKRKYESLQERQKQVNLAQARGMSHFGLRSKEQTLGK